MKTNTQKTNKSEIPKKVIKTSTKNNSNVGKKITPNKNLQKKNKPQNKNGNKQAKRLNLSGNLSLANEPKQKESETKNKDKSGNSKETNQNKSNKTCSTMNLTESSTQKPKEFLPSNQAENTNLVQINVKSSQKESETKNNNQWRPVGFKNSKGYCFFNSIIQVLLSCEGFRVAIEDYNIKEHSLSDKFVEELFNLVYSLKDGDNNSLNTVLDIINVQKHITESSYGDDVYKCFMNVLTRINNAVKQNKPGTSGYSDESDEAAFNNFKSKNNGFVFDNFYGQLKFQVKCVKCSDVCHKSYQMIKSLPLPVPQSKNPVFLENCLELFFKDSDIETDTEWKCKCENRDNFKSTSEITHFPRYLFIYLNRGSYTSNHNKNNTKVMCEKSINFKKQKYKLISVINHIGNNSGGHYYSICNYNEDDWWLLNDEQVTRWDPNKEIVSRETIVFVFKHSGQIDCL